MNLQQILSLPEQRHINISSVSGSLTPFSFNASGIQYSTKGDTPEDRFYVFDMQDFKTSENILKCYVFISIPHNNFPLQFLMNESTKAIFYHNLIGNNAVRSLTPQIIRTNWLRKEVLR